MTAPIGFVRDDGGRAAAGYRGKTGDCGVRAVAIATGLPYQHVYDRINELAKRERWRKKGKRRSSARGGVWRKTLAAYLEGELGWTWTPTMEIGAGCTVHLRADELPAGRLIARVTRHYTAVIDGTIRDTFDPSRDGTRCVYGFWTPPPGGPAGDDVVSEPTTEEDKMATTKKTVQLKKIGATKYEVRVTGDLMGTVFRTRRTIDGKKVQGWTYDDAPADMVLTGEGAREEAVRALVKSKVSASKTKRKVTDEVEGPGFDLVKVKTARYDVHVGGTVVGSVWRTVRADADHPKGEQQGWTYGKDAPLFQGRGSRDAAAVDLIASLATK